MKTTALTGPVAAARPIVLVEGDLLQIERGIILHQACCSGSIGTSALALRALRPRHFTVYEAALRSAGVEWDRLMGQARVGIHGSLAIAHCFVRYGSNDVNIEAFEHACGLVTKVVAGTLVSGLPVYTPYRMGNYCGLGDWEQCTAILARYFPGITIVKPIHVARHGSGD